MKELPFSQKELDFASKLIQEGNVKSILFSEGTYQIEVAENKRIFWPFLQIGESGDFLDGFCSCAAAQNEEGHCKHLAAAYLTLLKKGDLPLHVRFRSSLWNQLCLMASRRHGFRVDSLEKRIDYSAKSLNGKLLFSLKAQNEEGAKKIREIIEERPLETEETSLKFSNLDPDEIALWKMGKPSEKLKYELSFWSDLAKWCMTMQEKQEPYTIEFFPKDALPKWIQISFNSIVLGFYISKANWPLIIPSLRFVETPLKVYETSENQIKSILYNKEKKQFEIDFAEPSSLEESNFSEKEVELEGWKFIPEKGFVSLKMDPIFHLHEIKEDKIEEFLTRHILLLRRFLKEMIFEGIYKPQYLLYFDKLHALHIEIFLFEPGDLQKEDSAFWGRWAYLNGLGFYHLEEPLYPALKTVIPFSEVGDFVSRHKAWLNRFEGFQIHLMTVEPEFSYEVDGEGNLVFHSKMELAEELQGVVDFGEWIFIPSKGFLPKRKERMITSLKSGKKIKKEEIPSFLRIHKEELLGLPRFFSDVSPIDTFSLKVILTEDRKIKVEPIFSLLPKYKKKRVLFFQEYSFVEGEGFAKFPLLSPLLEEYASEKILSPKEESLFLTRIEAIYPWISQMDPRIKIPKEFAIRLVEMVKAPRAKGQWIFTLEYETEIGAVPLFEIWEAMQKHQKHLFSKAGFLDLTGDRFQWLKLISQKKWRDSGRSLSLSAMEWIRLQTKETIALPPEKEGDKTWKAFEEFQSCSSFLPLSLEGLKSTLRPYQETGLKWLWFLYSYGLSGLLCDEMGLGKTHQAMALLAGAFNAGLNGGKCLVVCPTSVIYHWEDLLARFLPHLKVYVFYGQTRQVEDLKGEYDVLLTSYGIMRSEKKCLGNLTFQIAIYDEIQNAKNAQSQTHKALSSLKASMVIGLTGTPIENNLMEIKALFDLILPNYLPADAKFKEQFLNPIEKSQDAEKKQLLSKIVKPFILRRKKSEVLLELPEKVEEISYCDLSAEQKKLYEELFFAEQKTLLKEIETSSASTAVMHVFALLSKLKQICNHPSLFLKNKTRYKEHSSGKWDLFVELLEEARDSKQKIVVFTQYLDMMDIIEDYLTKQGIGFAEIRGSTKDRKEPLVRFKQDPTCEVFVASLQAAGVGIDLTAASVVIHYDRWWNPARENQATDRVHRIGQSRGVQVFKLVTKRTVEERLHALILKKEGLLDEVVGFDDQDIIKKFTKQEIFDLLSAIGKDLQG